VQPFVQKSDPQVTPATSSTAPPSASRSSTSSLFRKLSRSASIQTPSAPSSSQPSRSQAEIAYQAVTPSLTMSVVNRSASNSETSSVASDPVNTLPARTSALGLLSQQEEGPPSSDAAHPLIPQRPWNWEADALELEALDDEKIAADAEIDEIQARALAPMDCNAVYNALARIHTKLAQDGEGNAVPGSFSSLSTGSTVTWGRSHSQGDISSTNKSRAKAIARSNSSSANGTTRGGTLGAKTHRIDGSDQRMNSLMESEEDEIDRPDEEMSRFFASSSMTR
jgi:hypothetical protein